MTDSLEAPDVPNTWNDEQFIRAVTETTPSLIYVYDCVHDRNVWTNAAHRELFGALDLDVTDRTESTQLYGLMHPDDIPVVAERLQRLRHLPDGQWLEAEYRFLTPDGAWHWFQDRASVFQRDAAGDVTHIIGSAIETTRRRKAEAAHRRTDALLQLVLDTNPSCIFVKDAEGRYVLANPAIAELYGTTPEKMIGLTDQDFADARQPTPLEADRFVADDQAAIRSQEAQFIPEEPFTLEDGSVRWFQTRKVPLKQPGEEPMVLGVAIDITDRKTAEEELRASEARYRSYVDQAPNGVFVADGEGFYVDVNAAAVEITGYTREELIGMHLSDLLPPEAGPDGREHFRTVRDAGYAIGDLPFIHRDGSRRMWRIAASKLSEDRYLGFVTDITAQYQAQRALAESERRYRLLAENVSDVIWLLNAEAHFTFISPSVERILGYTPEELREAPLVEFLPEAALQERFEVPIEAKDGRVVTLEVLTNPLFDDTNTCTGMLGVARDITARRRMTQALADSEERFRLAAESMTDLIYEWDVATGTVRWFGDIDAALGYEPGGFPRTLEGWLDRLHPDDRARMAQLTEHCHQNAIPSAGTYRIRHRDGTWLTWQNNGRPIKDASGEPVRWIGACVDITEARTYATERERLLAQVQAQARRTQQIIDTVPQGVVLVNSAGEVLLSNPAGKESLAVLADWAPGMALRMPAGQPLHTILQAPDGARWHELRAKDRIYEVVARPMVEVQATMTAWVLVIRDVTEEREHQRRSQLQERLATVGQLAAGIAHDFNNVMAAIVLYAQMLAHRGDLDAQGRRYVQTITSQANQATDLIAQILDFSRSSDLESEILDITPLVKEAVKLWKRTLPESIRVDLTQNQETIIIEGEATRLNQMLTNLAVNARDAMPDGGALHLCLEHLQVTEDSRPLPEIAPGPWVRITVRDTGSGIAEKDLPHIFDPFFTTKAPGKGTGLGLAQVYGIVQAHKGHIDVATQLGEGTAFTIYLPGAEQSHSATWRIPDLAEVPRGQGECLLVVEDNAVVRNALVSNLTDLAYTVSSARDGKEALRQLDARADDPEGAIRLVITDMVMPEMGGIELLRAIHDRGYPIRVIILTGYATEELEKIELPELIGWQHKPPDVAGLAQAIADSLH